MTSPNDKIYRNGQCLTRRVWDLIDHVGKELGVVLQVGQGGFQGSDGADNSAGTHDKGDVYDIRIGGFSESKCLAIVNELRKWYGDAWLRTPKYGWPSSSGGPHIHCVQADSYYALSRTALQQVVAYNNYRNGLANNAPDPFPHPTRQHWPAVVAPTTPPTSTIHTPQEDSMFLASVQYGANARSYWLVGPNGTVNVGGDEFASWTGAKMVVNDEATWRRIVGKYPQ